MPLGLFYESFLGDGKGAIDSLSLDARTKYLDFINHLYRHGDIISTFLNTTTFLFESIFMAAGEQMRYLNNVFYRQDELNPPCNKLFSTVNICPECMKEDIEKYGEAYLHCAHQLTGVKTCYKHHIKLKKFVGHNGHACEYEDSDYQEIETELSLDDLNAYTDYAYHLYTCRKQTNIKAVKNIVFGKIQSMLESLEGKYVHISREFNGWRHKALFKGDVAKFLKVSMVSARNMDVQNTIAILMFLFPNPLELIDLIKEEAPIISPAICEKCGHHYVASTLALKHNWGCPLCVQSKTAEERYKSYVKAITNDEYEAKSFSKMNKFEPIVHNACGKELMIMPRKFLFDETRCICERVISEEEVRQNIEEYKGFKLVNFNGAYKPITIFHETCGREFTCSYKKFKESPRCRKCKPKIENADMFEEQVRDLTGDEYSVVKGFVNKNTNVILRHNVCGEEQEYRITSFLDGSRCKRCTSPIESDELSKALSKISHGRYKLVYTGKKKHHAIDTETNKMFPMPLKKVYQEIVRPTPSPYFPMIDKSLPVEVGSAWENGFRILCDYKEEYGHLNIGDIENYKNFRLGKWCREQRTTKRDGRLKANKEEKLLSVGFDFNPKQTAWNVQCERYGRYVKENGKCYASRYVVYEDVRIGTWLQLQRRLFKEQKLPAEKIEKLERINPLIFTDMWFDS